jgi:hypothetical protein
MYVRRVRWAALAALIAAAMTMLLPPAAPAATTPIVGGGSFVRTAPFIDGWIYAFECHAAAAGAVSTSVDSCLLRYAGLTASGAPASTSQGPVASTSGAVSTNPADLYTVCWTVSARYGDGSSQSTSGCSSPASSIGGAG